MRYCFFDGADVVGPFPAEKLLAREGFNSHSLVCPEEHSEEEVYWKEAYQYPEFGFSGVFTGKQKDLPTGQTDFDVEEISENVPPVNQSQEETGAQISSLLLQASKKMQQENPASSVETEQSAVETAHTLTNGTEDVSVQLVATSRSPIEEYFNSMRTGDLGNILGIPDPKLNSDLNLVNMLEKQFEKTDPNVFKTTPQEEKDPFDSFVSSSEKTNTLSAEKDFVSATPDEKDLATQAKLQRELHEKEQLRASVWAEQEEHTVKITENISESDPQAALVVPLQEDDPNDKTVKTILENTFELEKREGELSEPIKRVAAPRPTATMPMLDPEKVIIPTDPDSGSHWMKWLGLIVGALILIAGVVLNLIPSQSEKQEKDSEPIETIEQSADSASIQPVPVAPRAEVKPVTPPVTEVTKNPEERAVEIVQNYVLDPKRGTVKDFLSKHHEDQLSSGYAGVWSAELLHRNTYVVKYRLSKTRQEPIVYIFQVDTAKNKLTGALNNITLDLVGKIK